MFFTKLFMLLLSVQFLAQQVVVVTKNNGDELRITSIDFLQGSKRSDIQSITFKEKGETKTLLLSELKRINLKEVASRKGITSWNAILVKTNNEKVEVLLPLDRIYGVDEAGNKIKISSSSIDKISF